MDWEAGVAAQPCAQATPLSIAVCMRGMLPSAGWNQERSTHGHSPYTDRFSLSRGGWSLRVLALPLPVWGLGGLRAAPSPSRAQGSPALLFSHWGLAQPRSAWGRGRSLPAATAWRRLVGSSPEGRPGQAHNGAIYHAHRAPGWGHRLHSRVRRLGRSLPRCSADAGALLPTGGSSAGQHHVPS